MQIKRNPPEGFDMNYLDLFSGIGGFAKGFHDAGFTFEHHYASEIDRYARSIYARQFPESIQLGDVTRIGTGHGPIDLITGGFPCQAFSIAGTRRGFEDTRGTLFFEIERLAQIYRPRYMVLENVKGLLNHRRGNTIRIILDKLRRSDFDVQLLLLNSKDFGVPQNRERVFFICTAPEERRPEISRLRERKTEIDLSANCIDANYNKGIDNHGQRTCIGTLRTHKDGEGFREMQSGLCPTIPARAREDGSGQPVVAQTARGFNKGGTHPISPTLTSNSFEHNNFLLDIQKVTPDLRASGRGSIETHNFDTLSDECIIRRLTPIECERLQTFPDNWTKYGKNGKVISDSQRYKCLGNSVTVEVIRHIAAALKKVML